MGLNKIKFFNGLNELRAIAALGVVWHHIVQFKNLSQTHNINDSSAFDFLIGNLGKVSVNLFFVLSGFLITYLLLKEKNYNKEINIKKFYWRRMLRIWPLYYLILFISFLIIPFLATFSFFGGSAGLENLTFNYSQFGLKTLLLYLFFLPQFAPIVLGASQSWSIGVEEQFYLVIPLVLTFFKPKYFLVFLVSLIALYFAITIVAYEIYGIKTLIGKIFDYLKIQYMTIGSIGGFLYFYNHKKIADFTKSKWQYVILVLFICYLMSFEILDVKLQDFILSILFLILIYFSINDSNLAVFRNKYFSYLGKISYGIYMFHSFVIFLILPFANKVFKFESDLFLYVMCYTFTILFSVLSYEFFELRFIKLKNKKYNAI